MKRDRGRPVKEEARTVNLVIRLTEKEANMLEFLSYETGKSKSEIVRESIETTYKIHTYSY